MNKELNPNLFGTEVSGPSSSRSDSMVQLNQSDSAGLWSLPNGPTSADLQEFRETERDRELKALKIKAREYEARIVELESKLNDQIKATTQRTERVSQRLVQLETMIGQKVEELNLKVAHILGKVHERRLTETKIEEMVDRHNNLVRSFETRMAQLTRALSEREIQLMNLSAVNEEARRELARLKRL